MRVAITGASGLIGTALSDGLWRDGHEVVPLRRGTAGPGELTWDPDNETIDADALRGLDAVVHLAGEPIEAKCWTKDRKRRIRDSRVNGTRTIATALAKAEDGPRVLLSASGVHYYGSRGDEVLTERSGPGEGFMSEVVQAWEAAADPAREAGVRVVHLRTGIVQTPMGGALCKQLPVFKAGAGAPFGSGRQYVSWIALDDAVGIIRHALANEDVSGPVNVTAPTPVTNAAYTRTLGKVLGRPTLPIGVPAFAPALLLGSELVNELLFFSARVMPEAAEESGYTFGDDDLETALRRLLH